jgi:recombination protein RecT
LRALIWKSLIWKARISEELVSKVLISETLISKALISETLISEKLISEKLISETLIWETLISETLISEALISEERISKTLSLKALLLKEMNKMNNEELKEKAEGKKMMTIPELIEASAGELGKALPNSMSPERLSRIALTCIRMNPDLAQCTTESLLGALFTSAQLGVEPIAGRAYLLPFYNKRKINGEWKSLRECQFILGYKGIVDMFYRHAKSTELSWGVVHEKDFFEYELGSENYLKHRPVLENRGDVIGYWVLAKLHNGGTPFAVMSHEDCIEHGRSHSKTFDRKSNTFYKSSPWATNQEAMCLKTVLIQLAKLLPMSVQFQQAIQKDNATILHQPGTEDILELPDKTNWEEEGEE